MRTWIVSVLCHFFLLLWDTEHIWAWGRLGGIIHFLCYSKQFLSGEEKTSPILDGLAACSLCSDSLLLVDICVDNYPTHTNRHPHYSSHHHTIIVNTHWLLCSLVLLMLLLLPHICLNMSLISFPPNPQEAFSALLQSPC